MLHTSIPTSAFYSSSITNCHFYQQYLPQLFHSISFFQIISCLPTTAPLLFTIHTSTTTHTASNFNSNIPALCFSTSSVKLVININPLPLFQKSCNIFFPSKYCPCFQATSVCQNNFTSLSSITQLFFAFYHHFLLLSSMTTALLPSVFSPIIHKPTKTMQLVSLSTLPLHLFLPLVQAKHHLIPASLMLPKSHTFSSHPTSTSPFSSFLLSSHYKQSSHSNYTIPFICLFLLLCIHSLSFLFHVFHFDFLHIHHFYIQNPLTLTTLPHDTCARIIIFSHHNFSAIIVITQYHLPQHPLFHPLPTFPPFQPHHHMHHLHLLSFFIFDTCQNRLTFLSHHQHHAFPSNPSISFRLCITVIQSVSLSS